MIHFRNVTIIGLGLIGGSLAMAFRSHEAVGKITGMDVNENSISHALELGIIDAAADQLADAVADADLILLATPVRQTIRQLEQLKHVTLKPGCIISDVSSTKKEICLYAKNHLPDEAVFIGGHPMAGSEKSGLAAASPRLFENAVYILTQVAEEESDALNKLAGLFEQIQAQVLLMQAEVHDRVVAAVSHIPHVIAAVLVDQVADLGRTNPLYSQLAAGGFRDVTRIASGSPVMWRDILLSNQDSILDLLRDWEKRIHGLRSLLQHENADSIEKFFSRTRDWRDSLPAKAKGAATHYYELTIDVEDKPGIIGQVATILGQHSINLRNIGILENREEVNGQLLLSFSSYRDLESAVKLLKGHGYKVYVQE